MKLDPDLQALLLQMPDDEGKLIAADGTPMILMKLPMTRRLADVPVHLEEMDVIFYATEGPVARVVFLFFDQTPDFIGISGAFGDGRVSEAHFTLNLSNDPTCDGSAITKSAGEPFIAVDIYINPNNPVDRGILARLTTATYIYFHGFGADELLPYRGSTRFAWKVQHQDWVKEILLRTQSTTTQWPAAKERWIRKEDQ